MIGIGFTRVHGIIFVAMLIMFVGMGSQTGADMAMNDTQGHDELANTTSELQNVSTEVEHDLEANTSGVAGAITKRTVTPIVDVTVGTAVASTKFGYHHPFLGRWLGRLAPFGMIGAMLAYIWNFWKRMKQL